MGLFSAWHETIELVPALAYDFFQLAPHAGGHRQTAGGPIGNRALLMAHGLRPRPLPGGPPPRPPHPGDPPGTPAHFPPPPHPALSSNISPSMQGAPLAARQNP